MMLAEKLAAEMLAAGGGNPTARAAATATAAAGVLARPAAGGEGELEQRVRREALDAERREPELSALLHSTVLAPAVRSFEQIVVACVAKRFATADMPAEAVASVLGGMFDESPLVEHPESQRGEAEGELEHGHTATQAVRADLEAVLERDPACQTALECLLFYKGYAALVAHRAAHRCWRRGARYTALWLQSRASEVCGVDIHPRAEIGAGVLLDHATGVVVGETATIGDGCTLLHGVTLGTTGDLENAFDRHPKIGKNVLIGANASVLGNIRVGDNAKIGAGSVVLQPVPGGATVVGVPAKQVAE